MSIVQRHPELERRLDMHPELSCALKRVKDLAPPTLGQHLRYGQDSIDALGGGNAFPRVVRVIFRPGNGRGRPKAGYEKRVFDALQAVERFLLSGEWQKYNTIQIEFVGVKRVMTAQVRNDNGVIELFVPGRGLVLKAVDYAG